MIVTIPIAFNITSLVDDDELTEGQAKDAASMAAFHHLIFTETGRETIDVVDVHVDGFGECRVRLEED